MHHQVKRLSLVDPFLALRCLNDDFHLTNLTKRLKNTPLVICQKLKVLDSPAMQENAFPRFGCVLSLSRECSLKEWVAICEFALGKILDKVVGVEWLNARRNLSKDERT